MNWIRQQHNNTTNNNKLEASKLRRLKWFLRRKTSFPTDVEVFPVLSCCRSFCRFFLVFLDWKSFVDYLLLFFYFSFLFLIEKIPSSIGNRFIMLFIPLLPFPFSGFSFDFLSSCLRSRSCSLKYKSKEKRREKYWKKTTDSSSVFVIQPTHRMKLEKRHGEKEWERLNRDDNNNKSSKKLA